MSSQLHLSDFHQRIERRVEWSDMDAARHVNNLTYLRWAEMSRVHYFEQMGIDISFASSEGMILAWQDCKYTFPMTYPDTAVIAMRTIELGERHFTIQTAIFSKEHQRLAAVSLQRIVPYDYVRLARVELPESWKQAITRLEGEGGTSTSSEEPD